MHSRRQLREINGKQQANNQSRFQLSSQQHQQICMTPQIENLAHMYDLVNKLVLQLRKNKKEKQSILQSIDDLSTRLNRNPERKKELVDKDIALFAQFLVNKSDEEDCVKEQYNNEGDTTTKLKLQNKKLKECLVEKRMMTKESLRSLEYHEGGLSAVVGLLRTDVVDYQVSTLQDTKDGLDRELFPLEDKEFIEYLKGITELNKIFEVTALYKDLLKVLDK